MKLTIKKLLISYKKLFIFIIGLIIGIRSTDLWDYANIRLKSALQERNHLAATEIATKNIADYLFNKTRVVCWIMTTPENHLFKAMHVRLTWGSRCNKLIFFGSESGQYIETIPLSVPEGRENLWPKTREAFKYLYDNHLDDADWFVKADDDTYMIMENLRYFLYPFSPEAPVYFGCKFLPRVEKAKKGYMSGGAGYVISREALRRYGEFGYGNDEICPFNERREDVQMSNCLQNLGVVGGDSRDESKQERFIPLPPKFVLPILTSDWYAQYVYYKQDKYDCCSSTVISFHHIGADEFYMLEYFLYELRVLQYQKGNTPIQLPSKANMTDLLLKWSNEKFNRGL